LLCFWPMTAWWWLQSLLVVAVTADCVMAVAVTLR
jgi:hypothetical protein